MDYDPQTEISNDIDQYEDILAHKNVLFTNLYGDSNRYLQILINFLSNAVKFTPDGGKISVRTKLLEIQQNNEESGKYYVKFQISIIDTGVGIEEENLDKLFIDFSRLGEHQQMNPLGTGLGLSICKKIINQMGGSVSAKSKINQGTTFFLELGSVIKLDLENDK